MKKKKGIQNKFDRVAKLSAVATGFIIPLSVSGISIFINVTSICACLSGQWRTKIQSLRSNAVLRIALLFFLLLVLTIPYSQAPWHDIGEYLWKYAKLLYLIFLMPLFFEEKQRRYGINAFLLAMIITLVAALLKRVGLIHLGIDGAWDMLFTNHINTGFLMAFAGFVTLHRCFITDKWRWAYRILFLIIVFFMFFVNTGRTGYIVFIALVTLFLWQKLRWRGIFTAAFFVPLLVAGLFFFSASFKQHMSMIMHDMRNYQQHQLENNSIGLRWQFARHSLELIKQHPFVGNGVGSFRSQYRQHFPVDPGFAEMAHPQNEYLLITEQLGLIGLGVFLWLLITEWQMSSALPEEFKNYAQGFVIAFAIGCLCDSFLFIMIPGYFFVYFSALFFAGRAISLK